MLSGSGSNLKGATLRFSAPCAAASAAALTCLTAGLICGFAISNSPIAAAAEAPSYACRENPKLARLAAPLAHMRRLVAAGRPITIAALGSSSTAGAGASSPAMSYPSRLEVELRTLMPRLQVTVVNRGVNGEESRDMLKRFERDVFPENPDLVIWQVGSNSVLRDRPLSEAPAPLNTGLKLLREHGADVVLMNPQYAPKVFTKHDVEGMVHLIAMTAKEKSIALFQRYAVMRYWQLTEGMPFNAFTSPDELHMNDWSYGCVAKLMAGAIHDAATRPTLTATVNQPR
jgi:acyl-CoA thioesterase I